MRIRIVQKPVPDSMDGVHLDRFEPGQTYEVGTNLGMLLLAEGWGEPADTELAPPPARPAPAAAASATPPNLIRELGPPDLESLLPGIAADFDRRKG